MSSVAVKTLALALGKVHEPHRELLRREYDLLRQGLLIRAPFLNETFSEWYDQKLGKHLLQALDPASLKNDHPFNSLRNTPLFNHNFKITLLQEKDAFIKLNSFHPHRDINMDTLYTSNLHQLTSSIYHAVPKTLTALKPKNYSQLKLVLKVQNLQPFLTESEKYQTWFDRLFNDFTKFSEEYLRPYDLFHSLMSTKDVRRLILEKGLLSKRLDVVEDRLGLFPKNREAYSLVRQMKTLAFRLAHEESNSSLKIIETKEQIINLQTEFLALISSWPEYDFNNRDMIWLYQVVKMFAQPELSALEIKQQALLATERLDEEFFKKLSLITSLEKEQEAVKALL